MNNRIRSLTMCPMGVSERENREKWANVFAER